ncbi:glycerol-3-phosphate dehydrogenase/oxidase [Pseudonocardia acaciae]|uniref:glycerol-3-phosphate dehydrogenase/oxidase n=1 Tax=Pseudonocardia acaciae TaxID=551276 RepID=UPI00048B9F79|nr:glycerol-3-phosphate dehydrogenase/oxidase [Pseudonocardia acaciae]
MTAVALSPGARADALDALGSGELDVLVIGGGVVGAGCALDAATRGLSVGLVEARDLAAGTSSRSSKLIHGGLRYLEMLDFRLVTEALRERGLLVTRLAPHLVRPVPFLYPLRHRVWERAYAGAGVTLYDALGPLAGQARGLPHHRHLTRRGARRLAPSLRKDALVGALQYYDAQVDDARYTLFLARTAAAYGARVATRARVVGLLREGGRVTGAELVDLESGRTVRARARVVINATGVWTDETQALAGERGRIRVRPSKGVHLVVPRDRIVSDTGLILRTEKSVLFVIPWNRHWIIGTTDTDWTLHKAHPAASASDIDYLLSHVNEVLTEPLSRDDVVGVYAGLRPLLSGVSADTTKLAREHAVVTPMPGLVVVAGGKYTTYRVMARDAVQAAVHELGHFSRAEVPPSCTEDVPLLGADGFAAVRNRSAALAARSGLHPARIERLLGRYGSLIDEPLAMVAADPSLGRPLAGAPDYLRVEIVYAATHEGARHLDDVLTRRTRISIETFHRGLDACEEAADLLAPVLGWTPAQRAREVQHYRARVAAERESQRMPDDTTADAARMAAPDEVPVA